MPTLIGTDLEEYIRYPFAATNGVIVNIPPLDVELEDAQVAMIAQITTPLPTLPASAYNVDNMSASWTNGKRGMYAVVTRSGVPIYRGTLVQDNESGKVYFPERNTGDTGESSFTAYDIQDNDNVAVYPVFALQSFWSRIDPYTITAYKFSSEEFDDSGTYTRQTEYPPPVCNIGSHRCITLASGVTTTTITGDATDSFVWRTGETLTYLWNLTDAPAPSGFPVSSTCTWNNVGVGYHLLSCTITSSLTGKSTTAYRWIFIRNGVNKMSFSDYYPTTIESDEYDRTGRKMTLLVRAVKKEDLEAEIGVYLYTGAPVLVTYPMDSSTDAWENYTQLVDGNFFGYIRRVEEVSIGADGLLTYRVLVLGPALYLEEIPNARQTLQVADPPTDWNEVAPELARVDWTPWFLTYYSAWTALLYSDYLIDTEDEPLPDCSAPAFNFPAGTLLGGIKSAMQYFAGGNFGSTSAGSMHIRRHPAYEETSFRDIVPVVWEWTSADVIASDSSVISLNPDRIVVAREVTGKFMHSTTDANSIVIKAARTNLFAPAHAVQQDNLPDYIVTNDSDGLKRLGHHRQRINKPIQAFAINALGKYDFIEPPLMEFHNFDFSGLDADLLTDYHISQAVPEKVSRQWQFGGKGISHRVNAVFEPLSTGMPAVLDPLDLPSLYGTWKQSINFKESDGGAYIYLPAPSLNWYSPDEFNNTSRGTYVAGVGWVADTFTHSSGSYGDYRAGVAIQFGFSSASLKSIKVSVRIPWSLNTSYIYMAFYYTPGGVQTQRAYMTDYGDVKYLQTFPPVTVNAVGFALLAHNPDTLPTPPTIKKITLEGDGTSPF